METVIPWAIFCLSWSIFFLSTHSLHFTQTALPDCKWSCFLLLGQVSHSDPAPLFLYCSPTSSHCQSARKRAHTWAFPPVSCLLKLRWSGWVSWQKQFRWTCVLTLWAVSRVKIISEAWSCNDPWEQNKLRVIAVSDVLKGVFNIFFCLKLWPGAIFSSLFVHVVLRVYMKVFTPCTVLCLRACFGFTFKFRI